MLSLMVALTMTQTAGDGSPRRSDKDYTVEASRKEAERTLQLYADCLVTKRPMTSRIDQFLQTAPGTPEFGPRGIALVDASCAPRAVSGYQMRINPGLMQSALYSALYRRRFAKAAVDITNRGPIDVAREFGATGRVPAEYAAVRELGDCIVRRDPQAARAVVLSRLGSDTEQAAISAMLPKAQQCISTGSTLRFSRTMLRGVVAEALYKLSVAPVAPTTPNSNGAG